MRLLLASALLATALLGRAHADGDALDDVLGPREIAVGEAMRGGATGATGAALNPAGIGLNRELAFEGGYGYRASDGASIITTSACDSTAGQPGCFVYDYIAANPDSAGMSLHRTTHLAGFAMSRPLTPRVLLGATVKYYHFDTTMPGESNDSGFNMDIGTTLRLSDMVSAGVSAQNLFGSDSPQFPRAIGGGMMIRPFPIIALSFDSRWRLDGPQQAARYGGGGELVIRSASGQAGVPLRLGGLHDNSLDATYITGGIGFTTMQFGIDIGGRRAVSGPKETVIVASMRLFGPRMPAPALE